MSLEELLNRLSDGLVVRSADWTSTPSGNLACVYTYQEVPQEVREQFKNELRSHILENTKESTTYSFEHWKDRDAWIVRSTLEVNNRSGMFLGMIMLPQRPIKLGADEFHYRWNELCLYYYRSLNIFYKK